MYLGLRVSTTDFYRRNHKFIEGNNQHYCGRVAYLFMPVYLIDPPEASDGQPDTCPSETCDDEFIKKSFLTRSFVEKLWEMNYRATPVEQRSALIVEFFVPLNADNMRYHEFMILIGASLADFLNIRMDLEKSAKHSAPRRSHSVKQSKSSEDIDIEATTDEDGVPFSLTDDVYIDSMVLHKLARLPTHYRVYDRVEITYPPPSENFFSYKSSTVVTRNVNIMRSFAVFGHPRTGDRLYQSAQDFGVHLEWLYRLSLPLDNIQLLPQKAFNPVLFFNDDHDCTCTRCPILPHNLNRYRAGEIVWISLDTLFLKSGKKVAHTLNLQGQLASRQWPTSIVRKVQAGYLVSPLNIPFRILQQRQQLIFASPEDISPYLGYQNQEILAAYDSNCFHRASVTARNASTMCHASETELIFGCEIICIGDWVRIKIESVVATILSSGMEFSGKDTVLLELAEIRNHATLSLDSIRLFGAIIVSKNVQEMPSPLKEIAVSVPLLAVCGRYYPAHPQISRRMPILLHSQQPFVRNRHNYALPPHSYMRRAIHSQISRTEMNSVLSEYRETIDKYPQLLPMPKKTELDWIDETSSTLSSPPSTTSSSSTSTNSSSLSRKRERTPSPVPTAKLMIQKLDDELIQENHIIYTDPGIRMTRSSKISVISKNDIPQKTRRQPSRHTK